MSRSSRTPGWLGHSWGGALVALGLVVASCVPHSGRAPHGETLSDAQGAGVGLDANLPQVGPRSGALVVAGGGVLGPEIWERFVGLAGGDEARIIVIPTAGTEDIFPEDWSGLSALRNAGAAQVRVLHTRDRTVADSPAFAEQLRWATGVWIPGGRQWRLVDAYLHTRVHSELWALLDRNGVIGGTSAGASIQADFLVRGDPSTNQIMISENYLEGFGFLTQTAVDQHLLARARESDLWEVLERSPNLLGIGVDEGTALLVRGDQGEVLGSSQVLFYAWGDPLRTPVALGAGAIVDLAEWRARSLQHSHDANPALR